MSLDLNSPAHVEQLLQIEQLINSQQLQQASQALNALHRSAPNDPRLFLLGGELAAASGNPPGTLFAAKRAYTLAPYWFVTSLYLAEVLSAQNQMNDAMRSARMAVERATAQNALDAHVLSRAARIARKAGEHGVEVQWLEQAHTLSPDDRPLHHQLAQALAFDGKVDQAVAHYSALIESGEVPPVVRLDRLMACLALHDKQTALEDAQALLVVDPKNAEYRYYHALACGETPESQPPEVVKDLFARMAPSFEQKLTRDLGYQLPAQVAEQILLWYPDKSCDVLDLGCGTGLLGKHLGRMNAALIGVDLSAEMVAQAEQLGVYHRFHLVNVLDALEATPADHYDIITALDVLIYVGGLESVIPNAKRILTSGGRFIFSCETLDDAAGLPYQLQATGRYAHSLRYVESLLEQAGMSGSVRHQVLRSENGQAVQGFVVTAQ